MKIRSPFLLVTSLSLLASCAQMTTQVEPYKPEYKKKHSFTFHAKTFSQKIKGLQVSIEKAPLHNLKFKAPVCTAVAPVATPVAKAAPQPKSAFGSLLSLATKVAKSSSTSKPKAGYGLEVAPEEIISYTALPSGYYAFKVTAKNSTNHVIELKKDGDPNPFSPLIRLVGPKGKVELPVSEKSVLKTWKMDNCYFGKSTDKAQSIFSNRESLIDSVLLPGETIVKYLYFKPASANVPGEWKLSLWEIPVMTDAAGRASETAHFHSTAEVKKWETTLKRSEENGPFKAVKKVQVYK